MLLEGDAGGRHIVLVTLRIADIDTGDPVALGRFASHDRESFSACFASVLAKTGAGMMKAICRPSAHSLHVAARIRARASAGSGALMTGRATTRCEAPAAMAAPGVITASGRPPRCRPA